MIIFEDLMVISGLIPMFLTPYISNMGTYLVSRQPKYCIGIFKFSNNDTINGIILALCGI